MVIKLTDEEKKEFETILEMLDTYNQQMHHLAFNILKGYNKFFNYYTYLYRCRITSYFEYRPMYEYYIDGYNPYLQVYSLAQLKYYFTTNHLPHSYPIIVLKDILKALIQEKDIFYEN